MKLTTLEVHRYTSAGPNGVLNLRNRAVNCFGFAQLCNRWIIYNHFCIWFRCRNDDNYFLVTLLCVIYVPFVTQVVGLLANKGQPGQLTLWYNSVERRSLTGELSLACTLPEADG